MKTIKVIIKQIYGQKYIYPVCDKAKLFLSLTRLKTFKHEYLLTIEKLGYKIEFVAQTL